MQKRPWLSNYLENVLTTIRQGRRQQDPLNPYKYKYYWPCRPLEPEFNHMVVVVLFAPQTDASGQLAPNNYVVNVWAVFLYGKNSMIEHYEYDAESDVLDVYFDEKRPVWTIELTPNIMISIDRILQRVISLTFMDYTELIRPTDWGIRSFPITGLSELPLVERDLVIRILNSSPVNRWLDVSSVQTLPNSPFAVTHLEPPPQELGLLALADV